MAIFSETNLPLGTIIKNAFLYWKKTLLYQLVFNILYISLIVTVGMFFMNYYGFSEGISNITQKYADPIQRYTEMQKYIDTHEHATAFSWIIIGALCYAFPLNIGIFYVYKKIDMNEHISISDLFVGYRGKNFFIFFFYFLFWFLIFSPSLSFPLLSFIWVIITLFTAPLMFFKNIRIFDSISINIQVLKKHFFQIVVLFLMGVVIKYLSIITFIGIPLFFGFQNALIYSMYRSIFTEEKK